MIRELRPSEQRFVRHATYTGRSVRVSGDLDIRALDEAFADLVREYPVLACRIGEDAEGRGLLLRPDGETAHLTVAPGDPAVVRIPDAATPVDPRRRLAYLDVVPTVAGQARATFFAHHAVADAGQCVELFGRLWSLYTDRVEGRAVTATTHDLPQSLEFYVERGGIAKGDTSGLEQARHPLTAAEREIPADPAIPAPPALARPQRLTLDPEVSARIVGSARTAGATVNGLVTAALLRAWVAETANGEPAPVACVYPVDLRSRLNPPVDAAAGTNMAGLTCFTGTVDPGAPFADLAGPISARLRADLISGLVHRSVLHFPDYYGPTRRHSLAGHVAVTNTGRVPDFRTPEGTELADYEIVYLSAHPRPSTGASAAVTFLVYTFRDRLTVGVLGGGAVAERLPEAVGKQLHALAAETLRA